MITGKIILFTIACWAMVAWGASPVSLDLGDGVGLKLVPIACTDGHTVHFGETEVTNRMWQAYLTATGRTRRDDVELVRVNDLVTAADAKDTEAETTFADVGRERDNGEWDDLLPPLPAEEEGEQELPEIAYVKGEDFGMAGASSLWDESLLWKQGRIPEGKEDYPVTFITVRDAHEFCRWLSGRAPEGAVVRLPTCDEWTAAAYGNERPYPWGKVKREVPRGGLYPVKAHPELNTPEGLFNMYGNASEFIYTDSDGYGGRVPPSDVPCITQWMGTDSFRPWDIPRKDYFGYCHLSRIRRDCWGFRVVMISNQKDANE